MSILDYSLSYIDAAAAHTIYIRCQLVRFRTEMLMRPLGQFLLVCIEVQTSLEVYICNVNILWSINYFPTNVYHLINQLVFLSLLRAWTFSASNLMGLLHWYLAAIIFIIWGKEICFKFTYIKQIRRYVICVHRGLFQYIRTACISFLV